jgi:hypothetical protein
MNNADDISQAERRRIMAEDRRLRTYAGHAQASLSDEVGGRFSVQGKPSVVGASPISYPAQPSDSPWHHDPVPDEGPLGYDINYVEPVGEVDEIAASQNTPASADRPEEDAGVGGPPIPDGTSGGRPAIKQGIRRI